LIYRDEVYNPETTNPGVAEISVAKQRNGKTGTFKVNWNSKFTLFENHDAEQTERSQAGVRSLMMVP
jgi:replicative DNA helicase